MRFMFLSVWASALLVLASVSAFGELRPFLASGGDRASRYQAYVDDASLSGFSSFSQSIVLRDCLQMVTSIYGRFQSSDRRATVMENCATEAALITERAPTQSLAWFVQAVIAAESDESDTLNLTLTKSRLSGPNEQWIAEVRVELAEMHYDQLDSENRAGNERDLLMLVRSKRGVRTLARRYIQKPEFRKRVADLVETLPEKTQREFVRNVRDSARQMGLI